MEKLKELLKTFEEERVEKLKSDVWKNDTISPRIWSESDITIYNKLQVISKEFGFIQWLVENNKIDIERLHKIVDYRLEIKENYLNAHDYNSNCLLMLLSIQDSPIQFLIDNIKV